MAVVAVLDFPGLRGCDRVGFERDSRISELDVPTAALLESKNSSSKISLHSSTHSSQMYTPGPAINLRTYSCDLPQKEHLNWESYLDISASYITVAVVCPDEGSSGWIDFAVSLGS